tara:strand:- start:4655 stop:4864 length:210 start_codon:yes stop_codon:yes gene_type:complete
MKSVEEDTSLVDKDFFFYNIASSEYCPSADQSVRILKHNYSLRDVLKLREMIDIYEARDKAHSLDNPQT